MTIHWSKSARQELTRIWLKADSGRRRAITEAARAVDKSLAINPRNVGESRPDDLRICFEPPLGVLFRAEEKRSIVRVVRIWEFR